MTDRASAGARTDSPLALPCHRAALAVRDERTGGPRNEVEPGGDPAQLGAQPWEILRVRFDPVRTNPLDLTTSRMRRASVSFRF